MKLKLFLIIFTHAIGFFISTQLVGQTTTIVILNLEEQERLRERMIQDELAEKLGDSILDLANEALFLQPRPLKVINYEGLLDTDPKRIDTEKSLHDMDATANLIYASYISDDPKYEKKAAVFVQAWAKTYESTGNPINENKFVTLFWSYYLFKKHFTLRDQQLVESWMRSMATLEMEREHTPNNNWQAKRLKIIGLIGCMLNDPAMQEFSIKGFKEYINTAYFADGTSQDLHRRDALHYHVSGIKPCISVFVNLSKFNPAFNMYAYEGEDGGSIKKSMEYVIPYIKGEKEHVEWVNSMVELDKKRAEAGLAKYQPGMLYDPRKALPTLEWACFFHPEWYTLIDKRGVYTSTWVGLLNSPAIRK
jgi:hypothetical protein